MSPKDHALHQDLLAAAASHNEPGISPVDAALNFVRTHLGMDVAYLSEFVDDTLVFRAVDAPGFEDLVSPGVVMPLEAVYCKHILDERLPTLMQDTADFPLTQTLEVTHQVPIKSHVSVPVWRSDGTPYGMFCVLGRDAKPDLNERDVGVLKAFANLSSHEINTHLDRESDLSMSRKQITEVLEYELFDIVYQPIMDASSRMPGGYEALCRFQPTPYRPPNLWFDEADRVGLQETLEIAVIHKALGALNAFSPGTYVSVNASPATVASGALLDALIQYPCERIVVEITEHARVDDYDALLEQINKLRFAGARIAIDDAGAGYSGLQQIVRLRPDIIKLDVSLTSNIDADIVRKSLSAALVSFAREIDAVIVAEGIETGAELSTLQGLGVPSAQGYFLGRPAPLAALLDNDTQGHYLQA